MNIEKSQGIVLSSIDFQEKSKIIKIFTPKRGFISLFMKNLSIKKSNLFQFTSLFSICDFTYKKSKGEMHFFIEGSLIFSPTFLRTNLLFLNTAGKLFQFLMKFEGDIKDAETLYSLVKSYLKKIPQIKNFKAFLMSYYLKVLGLEGFFIIKKECACKSKANFIQNGDITCRLHKEKSAFFFSDEEMEKLFFLQFNRSFQKLEKTEISDLLFEKFNRLAETVLS